MTGCTPATCWDDMTDPNWEPVMKRAAAIVTNRAANLPCGDHRARAGYPGRRRCGHATDVLTDGMTVTVSARRRHGNIYAGALEMEVETVQQGTLPPIPVKIMMTSATRSLLSTSSRLPNAVSAGRLEFIINNTSECTEGGARLSNIDSDLQSAVERLGGRLRVAAAFFEPVAEGIATLRRVLAQAGHRSDVRLQEQRVQEADRRSRYEPTKKTDARLPRCSALHRGVFRECFSMERSVKRVRE